MNKSKKSIYTAVSAILLSLLNGLLGLIVTRLVISQYGSDFNGLNSTANQFINMLLIVEGGFTLATNVALFKPLAERNHSEINRIMTASKNIFLKIGFTFLGIGILGSIVFAILVKSELPFYIAALTFIMTIVSTSFNLLYATKYRILLQTEQREYVLNFIKISTVIFSQSLIIAIVFFNGHMLLVRFVTMVGAIINSLLIAYICKKTYKFLDFKSEPNYSAIKGTKDVFIQKLTSMLYNTMPIIFIATTVGTMFASVYAVYNSIFLLIKSVIYSFINAPRMGLGQLLAEKDKNYVRKVFLQYEFIVVIALLSILSTTVVLIMPFISLYTEGINDIDYSNWYVALFLIGITFFEIIHIPSGNIINMSGRFKVSKRIQTIACIVLIIVMVIGSLYFGFYGILAGVLVTAVLLAVLEINYAHKIFFRNLYFDFFRVLITNALLAIALTYFEIMWLPSINGYFQFLFAGILLLIINVTVFLLFNLIFNKSLTVEVFNRFLRKRLRLKN